MLDIAVIGGGLCGLALAHSLHARRADWALFEARPRLGGRVLTEHAANGLPLDLGPTWTWPATQPQITRLIQDLGLPTLAQHDDGTVLLLDDPNRAPQRRAIDPQRGTLLAEGAGPITPGAVHGGARRLAGGMATLIDALATRLPDHRLHRAQVLRTLVDRGSHVELQFQHGGQTTVVNARRVVLALPPRLAATLLNFNPPLPDDLLAAMQATPTWMASAAKVAVTGNPALWRDAPGGGNAWVTHPQAALSEVFDASPADAAGAGALAGFVAIPAAQRPGFQRGLPMLVDSQLAMLFGPEAAGGEQHAQDWADERFTATDQDRAEDSGPGGHPVYGDEALHPPLWFGKLWLGGSETARVGGGYLEGALGAAARLRRSLTDAANQAANDATAPAAAPADPWAAYTLAVQQRREAALKHYQAQLHHALSQQQADQLTQRALLATLDAQYAAALTDLAGVPQAALAGTAPLQDGRHPLTPTALAPFSGLADELLAEALRFNATSCALSNFPGEHRPDAAYVHTIRRDLAATWQAFALQVNQHLVQQLAQPGGALQRPREPA